MRVNKARLSSPLNHSRIRSQTLNSTSTSATSHELEQPPVGSAMATAPAAHSMKYRYLGNSGLLVSRLSFGSWVTFDGNFGFDAAYDIMVKAYKSGVNFFDNAEGYATGKSETIMGQVVQKGIAEGGLVPNFDERVAKTDQLKPIAEELGCSVAQLAIAWCVSNENVSTVILGASNIRQLEENLKANDVVDKLTPEVKARIDAIVQFVPEPVKNDQWAGVRNKFLAQHTRGDDSDRASRVEKCEAVVALIEPSQHAIGGVARGKVRTLHSSRTSTGASHSEASQQLMRYRRASIARSVQNVIRASDIYFYPPSQKYRKTQRKVVWLHHHDLHTQQAAPTRVMASFVLPGGAGARMTTRAVDKLQADRRKQEAEHAALQRFSQVTALQTMHNQADEGVRARRRANHAAQLSAERMFEESAAQAAAQQQRARREAQQNAQLAHALESAAREQEQRAREAQRVCEASEELRELEALLQTAYLNKDRAAQQLEREALEARERSRAAAIEQQMEYDRQRALVEQQNRELVKRADAVHAKLGLQEQMLQRQDLRREAQSEADAERAKVEQLVKQIELEDAHELARRQQQRDAARELIDRSQSERDALARQREQEQRRQDDDIVAYTRRVEARAAAARAASATRKAHEDAAFRVVEAEIQAKRREDEQVEQLRDELWEEEMLQKKRQQEDATAAAKARAKDEMMASNALQLRLKQELVARQQAEEDAFNAALQLKFQSEARREMELAAFRRRQKEAFKDEIARHNALKQQMLVDALERERRERELQEREEAHRRRIVEQAKQRLLQEHADVLHDFLPRALQLPRPSSSSSSSSGSSSSRRSAFR
ncbi:hypothetical protein PybrP1_011419 [[Pythium] brassicae (nom. inval.)]|nr:hypothetical protein PybrP1_011419 [[Pythium] brassicae (nom. inval.)]